jgi:hypothetical protein
MSMMNWFKSKSAAPNKAANTDSKKPLGVSATENLKVHRQAHREQLYQVVREVMLRAEVLAASYKFKVLSLDSEGRQYLIMVDLLKTPSIAPEQWHLLESQMIRNAAAHHRLLVKAVYWRGNAPNPTPEAKPAVPERLAPSYAPPKNAARETLFEPIQVDEMLAFKNALNPSATPSTGQLLRSGERLHKALPGFEDTELMEPDDSFSPLSRTQYGDL